MFRKTGLDAAIHYFQDNLTDAYQRRDPHGWNLSHGLCFVAKSLQDIERRLAQIEERIDALNGVQPRRK